MKFPVVWLPEADTELVEARDWYDNIHPDLGNRFSLAVEGSVEALAENPLQFPVIHRGLRRTGVRRFPYALFFKHEENRILIIACFHGRRNPIHWRMRI